MTRKEVLTDAVEKCLKELYSLARPLVSWPHFLKENQTYSSKYIKWEEYKKAEVKKDEYPDKWEAQQKEHPDWENKSIDECIGPRPYEFYYLPRNIIKKICDSYVYSYRLDQKEELFSTIEILKEYCKNPIVDKYIERKGEPGDKDFEPGYRGYEHPDNLEKEIEKILFGRMSEEPGEYREESAKILQNKFFEFLDMAGNFYNWNGDLNSFNTSVYLGPSPNSNKEAVIKNWKKYRNQDIEIDDNKYKEEYDEYGE